MSSYEAGTLAGVGSFRCESCDFAVALHMGDEVPPCPSCGGRVFHRSSLFGAPAAAPAPRSDGPAPDWLEEARGGLVREGDYMAFDDGVRVRVVALQEGWTRIGRSLAAQLRLDDPTVSRRHALIHREDSGATVLDDRSLNGVFRNGERVERAEIADGDAVSVGRYTLHFLHLAGERSSQRVAGAARA